MITWMTGTDKCIAIWIYSLSKNESNLYSESNAMMKWTMNDFWHHTAALNRIHSSKCKLSHTNGQLVRFGCWTPTLVLFPVKEVSRCRVSQVFIYSEHGTETRCGWRVFPWYQVYRESAKIQTQLVKEWLPLGSEVTQRRTVFRNNFWIDLN